jgi:hypothetical protein
MNPEETRDLLIRMTDSLERMEADCLALKAVLQNALPKPGEPPLQKQVDDIREDAAHAIHKRYEELRAEIRRAAEDRRMVEIALRLPQDQKPN